MADKKTKAKKSRPSGTKPAKVAKSKKAAKKRTGPPHSGQSGPPLEDLGFDALNSKEEKVLNALAGTNQGERKVRPLSELAEDCFSSQGKKKGNSWARNALRRLVRGGWVEKAEAGMYRVTEKGRKRLQRVEEESAVEAKADKAPRPEKVEKPEKVDKSSADADAA